MWWRNYSHTLFWKIKIEHISGSIVSLPHFPHHFWRKIFLLLYSINWPNFIVWSSLLCEILGKICVSKPGCDLTTFEVNLIFLIKPFFLHEQKVTTKTKISWERKTLLIWNKKHYSSFLKGFQSANDTFFLEGESPTLKTFHANMSKIENHR